jgi:hypothetical protein
MGGNIVDSPAEVTRWAGTLLGPEGTAVDPLVGSGALFGSGSRPGDHIADAVGLVVFVACLGFGGVFVNWIVDASI